MAELDTDDKFVELDGVKYKEDPDDKGKALLGDDGKFVPFEEKEEKKEEAEETEEQKTEREKKEKEAEAEEDKKDPPIRKSVKDFIIDRKNEKIKKLKEKKTEEDDEEDDEEEEEVSPSGKKAIKEQIDGALKPVLDGIRSQSDNQELKAVLTKYPDAEKMEGKIRKYMEAYPTAPVEFIYLGLAAKQMKLHEKRTKADDKANADKSGGHTKRNKDLGSIPDVRNMSDDDFKTLQHKVRTGQFK